MTGTPVDIIGQNKYSVSAFSVMHAGVLKDSARIRDTRQQVSCRNPVGHHKEEYITVPFVKLSKSRTLVSFEQI
jgi:hypothetical protein